MESSPGIFSEIRKVELRIITTEFSAVELMNVFWRGGRAADKSAGSRFEQRCKATLARRAEYRGETEADEHPVNICPVERAYLGWYAPDFQTEQESAVKKVRSRARGECL